MKRLFIALLSLVTSAAFGTTLNPIQLLNPAGSTSGQAIVSTGASSVPAWSNLSASALAPIAANTVVANSTGSTAAPSAISVPSCSAAGNALQWTSGTGFSCAAAATSGRLINVQVFTASGTYTPTSGTNSIVVELQSAGGGTGGVAATAAGTIAASTGSGSGAYAKVRFTSGFSGATVTIGAAGAAGASGSGAGGNGSTSSFGVLISCPGGNGTGAGPATSTAGGMVAGAGQTAACTISGGTTIASVKGAGTNPSFLLTSAQSFSSPGANSVLGIGGSSPNTNGGSGVIGTGYGSGSSAPINSNSQAAQAGIAGAPAVVIIYEYN